MIIIFIRVTWILDYFVWYSDSLFNSFYLDDLNIGKKVFYLEIGYDLNNKLIIAWYLNVSVIRMSGI